MNFTLVLDQGLQALLVVSLSTAAVGRVAGWPRVCWTGAQWQALGRTSSSKYL